MDPDNIFSMLKVVRFQSEGERTLQLLLNTTPLPIRCWPTPKWSFKLGGLKPELIECCDQHVGHITVQWWRPASEEERKVYPRGGFHTVISAPAYYHVLKKRINRMIVGKVASTQREKEDTEELKRRQQEANKEAAKPNVPTTIELTELRTMPELASNWTKEFLQKRCAHCKTFANDFDKKCAICQDMKQPKWEKVKVKYVHIKPPKKEDLQATAIYKLPTDKERDSMPKEEGGGAPQKNPTDPIPKSP